MGDPLKGRMFNIGGEDRKLLFTLRALRILEKAYPGRRSPEVVTECCVDVVCEMGAAAMAHTGAVTPDRVEGWLETAMTVFLENHARFIAGEPLVNVVDKQAGY